MTTPGLNWLVQSSAAHVVKPRWIVWWHIGIEMARERGLMLVMTHDEMRLVPIKVKK